MSNNELKPVVQRPRMLIATGMVLIAFTILLAVRVVWEETSLTLRLGPQMIGFSLAYGYYAPVLLAPLLLVIWLITALVIMAVDLWRKRSISKSFWSTLSAAVLVLGILSFPPVFWQWIFIQSFAKSPHAPDLMTYAAAEGDLQTVRGYLEYGVPLESKNYEGSTAAFTAAAGGSVPVLAFLTSRGADLNRVNLYGDSPLEAAVANHHDDAVAFLKAHSAVQIRGTEEQRQAASESNVRKDIEAMEAR